MGGLRSISTEEAEFFAAHGYVGLVLDYYEDVRWGGLTIADRAGRWNAWENSVVAAVALLRARPDVDPDRIVLCGISQGAALALTSAVRIEGVAAVIDYFGPHPHGWYVGGFFGRRTELAASFTDELPPVLILHGAWDPIVPASNSRRLLRQLEAAGRTVEVHVYPRTLHALNDAQSGLSRSTVVADDARARVFRFLETHVGAP
jgi:dienelactone hydrolase